MADLTSLLAGLVALVSSGLFLLDRSGTAVDGPVAAACVAVALGLVGLGLSVRRLVRRG